MAGFDELVQKLLEEARARGGDAERQLQRQVEEAAREGEASEIRVFFLNDPAEGVPDFILRRGDDGELHHVEVEQPKRPPPPRPEGGDVLIGGKPAEWDGYEFVSQKEEMAAPAEAAPIAVHVPKRAKQCPVCYQHTQYETKSEGWVCISEACDRGGRAERLGFDVAEARRRAQRAAELDAETRPRR